MPYFRVPGERAAPLESGAVEWRTLALECFSQRVLVDCGRIYGDESLTAYERYLELYDPIQDRNRAMSKTFDDLRRATVTTCLMLMWRQGFVTEDELSKFSPEVQRAKSID